MGVIQVARQLPWWLWGVWCSGRGRWKYQGSVWRAFVCEAAVPVNGWIGMEWGCRAWCNGVWVWLRCGTSSRTLMPRSMQAHLSSRTAPATIDTHISVSDTRNRGGAGWFGPGCELVRGSGWARAGSQARESTG